jgi:hypothetical protein
MKHLILAAYAAAVFGTAALLERCWINIEKIRAKQRLKPKFGTTEQAKGSVAPDLYVNGELRGAKDQEVAE